MKRNIFNSAMFLAMAALTFTACSSSEDATSEGNVPPVNDQTAINFGAYMNRSTTRGGWAGELTTATLQGADAGFGILAYYTDNQPYTPSALPNFMYNQQVTFNDPDWTYSPLKYWPNEFGETAVSTGTDRLSFFAYAPYVEVDPVTGYATADADYGIVGMTRATENGNPKVRYYASLDPDKRVDLCWALTESGNPGDADYVKTVDLTKQTVNDKVKFNFRHALASVNVQIDAVFDAVNQGANPIELDSKTRIWVRSVTFEGFATKGELNLNNDQPNPEWYNIFSTGLLTGEPVTIFDGRRDGREGFSDMPNEKPIAINPVLIQSNRYDEAALPNNLSIFNANTVVGVTTATVNLFDANNGADDEANKTMPIFVIPTGEPLRITITYDVETYDPKLVSSFLSDTETHGSSVENKITQVVLNGADPLKLEAGKKYTIGLHLGMTSVKTTATVTEWTAGDNTNTDLPANNN